MTDPVTDWRYRALVDFLQLVFNQLSLSLAQRLCVFLVTQAWAQTLGLCEAHVQAKAQGWNCRPNVSYLWNSCVRAYACDTSKNQTKQGGKKAGEGLVFFSFVRLNLPTTNFPI